MQLSRKRFIANRPIASHQRINQIVNVLLQSYIQFSEAYFALSKNLDRRKHYSEPTVYCVPIRFIEIFF